MKHRQHHQISSISNINPRKAGARGSQEETISPCISKVVEVVEEEGEVVVEEVAEEEEISSINISINSINSISPTGEVVEVEESVVVEEVG